jgi:hypothetical protein
MAFSFARPFAGIALATAVVLAPQPADANLIQIGYTGYITYSFSDSLGLYGGCSNCDVDNAPAVSGTAVFNTAGVTPQLLNYGFGSEWRHFSASPGWVQASASFPSTNIGALNVNFGVQQTALQMYYSDMPWGHTGNFASSDGMGTYVSFGPRFVGDLVADPSNTASVWSASVAGGTLDPSNSLFDLGWANGGMLLSGRITSIVLTDITNGMATPEPASLALLGFGLAGLTLLRRRAA